MHAYLAPTVSSLGPNLRSTCDRLHQDGWRAVQLSAAMAGTRPRELGTSARRDLAAMLRRFELVAAGMDLWIPREHYLDPATVDRVIATIDASCDLASDLGIGMLSVQLPKCEDLEDGIHDAILDSAMRRGIQLADHRIDSVAGDLTAAGLDPAACFSMDVDPVDRVISLGASLVSPRLSDLNTTGFRGAVGLPGGRLEVAAYRAAVVTVAPDRPVVLDLRQLESPWAALEAGRQAWKSAGLSGA